MTGAQFTDIIHEVIDEGYTTLPFSLNHLDTQYILNKSYSLPSYDCVTSDGNRSICADKRYLFSDESDFVAAYADENDLLNDVHIQSIMTLF